jgi:hypothetical protein
MNTGDQARKREYRNDFISVVIQPAPERGTFLFCSSINLPHFTELCKDAYGIGSNPAFKGLQLLRADVSAFCRDKGARPVSGGTDACDAAVPKGHGWYHESLRIENVPPSLLDELLSFSVITLINKVLTVCRPDVTSPRTLMKPDELQKYIASL